ncbi:MAG: guanylate kinase [Betaproteobacteria bacterium]|jgi:guanylate kinase|nr:guanylate kinase [Betaproteobacteria bacterium]
MKGQLFIITAPSGAGKSSLIAALLQRDPLVRLSVSHTTRPPRSGEIDGIAYHFVDREQFIALRDHNQFLEWAEVYGNYYGTSKLSLVNLQAQGSDVILEIDWQGARQVRSLFPGSTSIFILPPSLEALHNRLIQRGKDDEETIARRLQSARDDISHENEFDYAIINDRFDDAVADLSAILRASRCLRERQSIHYASLLSD